MRRIAAEERAEKLQQELDELKKLKSMPAKECVPPAQEELLTNVASTPNPFGVAKQDSIQESPSFNTEATQTTLPQPEPATATQDTPTAPPPTNPFTAAY